MGTTYTSINNHKRFIGFKRLFMLNFIAILAGAFLITSIAEGLLLSLMGHVDLGVPRIIAAMFIIPTVLGLPFVFLGLAALLFAQRMGKAVNQPVQELMQAVDKIRQHDLNFSIRYDQPNELGALCRAFNILRAELQESLEREWRRQEEMRIMLTALSHDLRTPVTIIQGHIEGLIRAGEKRVERLERYLPVLESCSQRMSKLLNDMLLLSSLEQANFLIQPQPVQLRTELVSKAHLYQLQASERGHKFHLRLPEIETHVLLDWHRVEQILDNLFENALRHTLSDGEISLSCTYSPQQLTLSLRDTGEGIAAEDLPHIFEKFYHGKGQQARQHKASGLGLAICKLLVEKQGGTISVTNHPEGGCIATFSLPLHHEYIAA
ncbi:HAMP domain-containing histidine kinase [Ktedonosporobacter rubrisoli]|uniref:histidine kinase n=1 Tax=Ktedonosporobacter rubrisoli TaxID=2509675 RepID=A0A4P6JMH6_KTERU|nr:HAMP domain-containing sensor histidine kinase [Ktedonosporobacter rubrisoli]QBD76445.1 HAMP domain-containing histidine kinase [Ktedonosporobacter rubrisoli]